MLANQMIRPTTLSAAIVQKQEHPVLFWPKTDVPENNSGRECLKKNQSTPRPSKHPPVMGEKLSKRLGGIKGCKYKTSSWHSNRFPDADNIGSTV